MQDIHHTEQDSHYDNLEQLSAKELLIGINTEDSSIAKSVAHELPSIEALINVCSEKLNKGGRLFYIGAGTSGRLGILDASECPPTYGVDYDKVIGLIAGGDAAIRKAVEFAEDNTEQAWKDLQQLNISKSDFLIGISASGKTPYVVGGLEMAKQNGVSTGCISCNKNSKLGTLADYPVEVATGAEFVTGSTRMKAGTAQKMVLNMISTVCMIKLGRVKGNKMVDMQIANNKLIDRAVRMIMGETNLDANMAAEALKKFGCVRAVIEHYK
ncbi:MAG: N-acetylmuramic acid 6-phosphate etherase [Bacteroidia bacterium]|nr:N-acetylmuramic acid 6-phosphate etherase [Bacteroidia bacterium]MCO5254703.1 N-acetylmuramic acid 6-phosphate etherase [Bacteroidota bacterium]MCZ2130507.1 N-acetylmuramic acid 6-phosphate etherase [Bacteroidia bacterium]